MGLDEIIKRDGNDYHTGCLFKEDDEKTYDELKQGLFDWFEDLKAYAGDKAGDLVIEEVSNEYGNGYELVYRTESEDGTVKRNVVSFLLELKPELQKNGKKTFASVPIPVEYLVAHHFGEEDLDALADLMDSYRERLGYPEVPRPKPPWENRPKRDEKGYVIDYDNKQIINIGEPIEYELDIPLHRE